MSLVVGLSVAALAVAGGLVIGLAAGYLRSVDNLVMRLMDGLMAIPAILLAIALISLNQAGVGIVIVAITIPEIPRVVRLVRSVVLTTREQLYIEAAISGGSRRRKIILRHILPSTIPPLIVQATYVAASAILIEAGLSFLGAGVPLRRRPGAISSPRAVCFWRSHHGPFSSLVPASPSLSWRSICWVTDCAITSIRAWHDGCSR